MPSGIPEGPEWSPDSDNSYTLLENVLKRRIEVNDFEHVRDEIKRGTKHRTDYLIFFAGLFAGAFISAFLTSYSIVDHQRSEYVTHLGVICLIVSAALFVVRLAINDQVGTELDVTLRLINRKYPEFSNENQFAAPKPINLR